MPAIPCGSLVVSPPLSEGQVDSLLQRQDFYSQHLITIIAKYLPEDLAGKLHNELWSAWNFVLFPEYFGGDETKLMQRAYRLREDDGGIRPMPNGYRPDPEADANKANDALGNPKRKHKSRGVL